jgi:hypothetical protein
MPASRPPTISYERLEPSLRTGDVFLFHGSSGISLKVEQGTKSQFSHAAMVIRPHPGRRPYLWQTGPSKIVEDRWTHTGHGGAQLGDLREALTFMANPAFGDQAFVRRLRISRSKDFETLARMSVADIDGRPFPTMTQMIRQWQVGQTRRSTSDRTLFCAELVAETYMRMGLLLFDPPPNAYSPHSFSSENPRLPLRKKASLGRELQVAPPRTT